MADHRIDTRVRQAPTYLSQGATTAAGIRRTVLVEEAAGRPAEPVTEDAQSAQIDSYSLISHHTDGIADHDAGLVDGEDVEDGAGPQPGVGKGAHPAQRNGLGVGEACRIHDSAYQCGDTVGFELGDGRCGERFGDARRHMTILRGGAPDYSVILQLWPMSSVRSIRPMPSHIAHDSARSVSSSSSNCSPARAQKSSSSRRPVWSLAKRS